MDLIWNKYHFLAYLFLFAAKSDSSIDQDELDVIKEEMLECAGFDQNDSADEIIKEVLRIFVATSHQEHIQFIRENKNHFLPTEADVLQAIDGVENIFAADLHIQQDEVSSYQFIKRILLNKEEE